MLVFRVFEAVYGLCGEERVFGVMVGGGEVIFMEVHGVKIIKNLKV